MPCFNVVTVIVQNCKPDVNGNLLVWKMQRNVEYIQSFRCRCARMKRRENLGNSHFGQHCDVLRREGTLMLMSVRSRVMLHSCGVVIFDI